jgi:hypothetical protein
MAEKPDRVTLRAYDVGFGDCFLLTFHYSASQKHLLIDFGSTRKPKDKAVTGNYMERIAKQIAVDCNYRLTAVIATHRHKDHISGFDNGGNKGPGEIIRNLKPEIVLQPWTEDPDAERDARKPTKKLRGLKLHKSLYVRSLTDMGHYASFIRTTAKRLRGRHLEAIRSQLDFLGDDNDLKNRDAVVNLMTMGKRPARYLYATARSGLESLLPGVKVHVLGPPTLEQEPRISTQTATQADEFWHLRAGFWARRGAMSKRGGKLATPLFAHHVTRPPWDARWYRYRAQKEQAETLLSIVRTLDTAMNNTSLILLFEVGKSCLLFPGDAQWENWRYALSQPKTQKLLKRVDLYKVGHHGSLNATPKSLWKLFETKGPKTRQPRLLSVLSTKNDVHGTAADHTEVPRQSLVDELTAASTLIDTRAAAADALCVTHEIIVS